MCNDKKDDIKLTDTQSTKLDRKRSKREDLIEQLQIEMIERSKLNVEIVKAQLGCGALNTMET